MAEPLDVIIRKYVAPAAKQEGLSRKGRYFRLEGPHSHSLLYFDTHAVLRTSLCFEVSYALLPLSYWDFLSRVYPAGQRPEGPGRQSILLNAYLMPPDEWSLQPDDAPPYTFKRRWAVKTLDDLDSCGTALAQRLAEEAFPRMRWLLDPDNALAELKAPAFTIHRALGSDVEREIMLAVDTAEPAHLEQLLADPTRRRFPELDAWVRERRGLAS